MCPMSDATGFCPLGHGLNSFIRTNHVNRRPPGPIDSAKTTTALEINYSENSNLWTVCAINDLDNSNE